MKRRFVIVVISVLVMVVVAILFSKFFMTGNSVVSSSAGGQKIQISPLNSLERQKVINIIESNSLLGDMPKAGIISLRFFDFKDGKRIWQDGFLIGKDGILQSGEPDIIVILHSKYIPEFNKDNFCEVIQKAKKNQDLGFISQSSSVKLLWKYKGMMKHKNCFGF